MNSTQLLVVLGFNSGDAIQAEQLLDWCFELNGREASENPILLVAAPNVHPELQMKVKLTAEVAFNHVELVVAGGQIGDKIDGSNRLFKAGAQAVANRYRSPWIWLEPDCVPLRKGWLTELEVAYAEQPKRFFGPHLKFKAREDEKMCVGRIACYPNDAATDLSPYCDSIVAFNQLAAEVIVARSTKARLIQQLEIHGKEDLGKIRPDAVLLHSDKTGEVIRHYKESAPRVLGIHEVPINVPIASNDPSWNEGRAPAIPEIQHEVRVVTPPAEPKLDGRSKEARARKAALA